MSKVRAHGVIVDKNNVPVLGKVYFYLKDISKGHFAVISEDTKTIVGPGVGRYVFIGLNCDAIPGKIPGFFDLPGGVEPGEYALHIHHGGKKEWAWPFVVTDGVKEQTVRIGGPLVGNTHILPFKNSRKILLFGDSDSSPKGETLSWRTTDVTDYLRGDLKLASILNCGDILTENCAQGATPVHPAHMDHDGGTQVKEALQRINDADFAICRYGLNDCHSYMQNPVQSSREKFFQAYSDCINMLKAKNITPVLVKIQLERRMERRPGILAANAELERLAREHNVILVDPSIEWENDKNIFHTDGIHLINAGQQRVAEAIKSKLSSVFGSGVATTPPSDASEFNIQDVEFTYDKLDIGAWPETAKLRGVTITGTEGDGSGMIKFDWDIPSWPAIKMFGDGALTIGNPVVIVKKNGKWYGASFTWLRPGQKEKGRFEIDDPTIKQGPLVGWKPSKGETVYFMIAGLCREKQRNVSERTNVVKYTF